MDINCISPPIKGNLQKFSPLRKGYPFSPGESCQQELSRSRVHPQMGRLGSRTYFRETLPLTANHFSAAVKNIHSSWSIEFHR